MFEKYYKKIYKNNRSNFDSPEEVKLNLLILFCVVALVVALVVAVVLVDAGAGAVVGALVVAVVLVDAGAGAGALVVAVVGVLAGISFDLFWMNLNYEFKSILILFVLLIILTEIIFWLFDKEVSKKKDNTFKFTIKRKLICFLKAAFIEIETIGFIRLCVKSYSYLKNYFSEILKWIGYIGLGLIILCIIIGIFYLWIKLNEIKYK